MVESIRYSRGSLSIVNQLLLPHTTEFLPVHCVQDAFNAIRSMKVRGAPAIAVVGSLSLAVELHHNRDLEVGSVQELVAFCHTRLDYLVQSRPTAVNMRTAADHLSSFATSLLPMNQTSAVKLKIIEEIESMLAKDVEDNHAIGRYGSQDIVQRCCRMGDTLNVKDKLVVLTICNTGSLATAGYGTALGVIRSLNSVGKLERVYYCETRPYCQGSRLTAYELLRENIPATLICDSAAGWLMTSKKVDCVVTGADRVAANGDSANKIGTYMLAVLCKHHNVPFYIAAPTTTCDMTMESGNGIVVEERDPSEVTHIQGVQVAPDGVTCWNPSFDVTPAALITGGIITEKGLFHPNDLKEMLLSYAKPQN